MLDWLDDVSAAVGAGVATFLIGSVLVAIWFMGQAAFSAAFGAERGIASVYSSREGKWTASGERMNDRALIAAHRTLRFGSKVLVRHGRKSAIVTILDRGPHIRGRIIDLSPAAARAVGLDGLGNVEISVLN